MCGPRLLDGRTCDFIFFIIYISEIFIIVKIKSNLLFILIKN